MNEDSVDVGDQGVSNSNNEPKPPKPKEPPKNNSALKRIIKRYHSILLLATILFPIIPFVVILVQTIIYPGLRYCTETNCPSSYDPPIPDVAVLVIGFTFYVISVICGTLLLIASGSWSPHAYRDKIITMFMFFLILCSSLQIIPAAIYRGYIVPFKVIQNYNIEVIRESDNLANLVVSNISYDNIEIGTHRVMVQIREVSENTNRVEKISPHSDIIFQDEKYSMTSDISISSNFSREVHGLEDGKWYMFLILPSREGVTGGNAYPAKQIRKLKTRDINFSGKNIEDVKVDVRAFKKCLWDRTTGCVAQNSIH